MEVFSMRTLLKWLLESGLMIRVLVTDRWIYNWYTSKQCRHMHFDISLGPCQWEKSWEMNSLEFYISLMSGKINVKQRCIEFKQAIYFRHFVKGIKNAIFKLSKRKDCQILLRWQKSVTNTVWYALAKYKGKFGYRNTAQLNSSSFSKSLF